jgi:hypothetical protein
MQYCHNAVSSNPASNFQTIRNPKALANATYVFFSVWSLKVHSKPLHVWLPRARRFLYMWMSSKYIDEQTMVCLLATSLLGVTELRKSGLISVHSALDKCLDVNMFFQISTSTLYGWCFCSLLCGIQIDNAASKYFYRSQDFFINIFQNGVHERHNWCVCPVPCGVSKAFQPKMDVSFPLRANNLSFNVSKAPALNASLVCLQFALRVSKTNKVRTHALCLCSGQAQSLRIYSK